MKDLEHGMLSSTALPRTEVARLHQHEDKHDAHALPDDRRHSPKTAATYLGCSESLLEKHRAAGTGPKYRKRGPGKYAGIIYLESDLRAWLDQFQFTCISQYSGRK